MAEYELTSQQLHELNMHIWTRDIQVRREVRKRQADREPEGDRAQTGRGGDGAGTI
jgi:hypothetical protein